MVKHKGIYSRGRLKHFDLPGRPQFITFRLADSLPQKIIQGSHECHRANLEQYLDAGYGECWLRREDCARIVIEALKFHDGKRYRLNDWVIMPNHVHVSYDRPEATLERITHSWKSYTSKQINAVIGRTGTLWQAESFDRYIRDDVHMFNVRCYIYLNPVRAGLVDDPFDWPYSSIHGHESVRDSLRRWYRRWRDRFWSLDEQE